MGAALDFDDLLGITLDDLRDRPRWVAWRLEDGRKIPINPHTGGNAQSGNFATWAPRENAEARARRIGGEGTGIMLGDHPGGCIGGVDLDGCRDPATGELELWAAEILDRFATYAEVSPSGAGVKAFFIYNPADLPRYRETFDGGEWGRSFTAGRHRGPEVHLGGRWYAATGERLPGSPVTLRDVPADDLLWLLEEAGPRFKAAGGEAARDRGVLPERVDRSAELMRLAASIKATGGTLEDLQAALPDNPAALAHVEAQGRERMQMRALRRAWERAEGPVTLDLEAALAELDDLGDLPDAPLPADDSDGKPDLSDDRLARDFGRAGWKHKARWCGPLGGWLIWDGARWQRAERLEQFTAARAFLVATADGIDRWAARKADKLDPKAGEALQAWATKAGVGLKASARIAAVELLARSNPGAAVAPDQFDADDMLLGTPGGVVDLRTGALRPAERGDYITKVTAVAPAAEGTQPERWLHFLAECFPDNPEIPDFLQRLAGYALTGETREHKVFFFWGTGRNGKGSFLNTLTWLLGDYAATVATSVLLESRQARRGMKRP
jgi:putative DNA primase/helicase